MRRRDNVLEPWCGAHVGHFRSACALCTIVAPTLLFSNVMWDITALGFTAKDVSEPSSSAASSSSPPSSWSSMTKESTVMASPSNPRETPPSKSTDALPQPQTPPLPSMRPTARSTRRPTISPNRRPTRHPTRYPTRRPTRRPTTTQPTTLQPTARPSRPRALNLTALCIVGHARTFETFPVYSSHIERLMKPLHADAFIVLDANPNHDSNPRHGALAEALSAFGPRLKKGLLFSPAMRKRIPLERVPQVRLVADPSALRGESGGGGSISPPQPQPQPYNVGHPICADLGNWNHVKGQFGKVRACFEMVKAHEGALGERYRYVIFVRPDLYFARAVGPLEELQSSAVTMGWCHESAREPRLCSQPLVPGACEVPNDWIGAVPRALADTYFRGLAATPRCREEAAYRCGCHAKHFPSFLPSECIIGAELRSANVSIAQGSALSQPMMLARVVSGWVVKSNTGVFARSLGLKRPGGPKWYLSHDFRRPYVGAIGPQH
jgi:hypothetical protein